ncbi:polyketide synthetase, partial [Mycobacterium uberis]
DYPTPNGLATYMRAELVGPGQQGAPTAALGEAEIRRVVASIPVKRLRQAGVLNLLLGLANYTSGNGQVAVGEQTTEKDIADMDLDDLVNAAFTNDDD